MTNTLRHVLRSKPSIAFAFVLASLGPLTTAKAAQSNTKANSSEKAAKEKAERDKAQAQRAAIDRAQKRHDAAVDRLQEVRSRKRTPSEEGAAQAELRNAKAELLRLMSLPD